MTMSPPESPWGRTLLSMMDIAELAHVKRPVVSTWRRRYADFPQPAIPSDTRPLFSGHNVVRWLAGRALGNVPADRLHEELALHSITAFAAEFGPRRLVEITGSLLCLRHMDERPLPDEWAELLRRAERMDVEDEFLLHELRAADSSSLTLAHFAEELIEAAYTPGGAYEWLLAARSRFGLTDLAIDLLHPELLQLVADIADLPARQSRKRRIAIADPHAGAGDLLIALIKQTEERDGVQALAAERHDWLARLIRRRLLLAGIDDYALDVQTGTDLEERMADPDLVGTQLPYRPGETRSVLDALIELDRVSLLLHAGATAVVIGPADALVDRLTGTEEAQTRSELLRSGVLEAVVNLPGGASPYRPGYRAALWVMTRDPMKEARGRVLVCDISAEPFTERVRSRLAEDILLWRAEGYRPDGHDPRFGEAIRIERLDADFGGPLASLRPPAAQLRASVVTERPALVSQAELRLEQAAQRARNYAEEHGQLRSRAVHRAGRRPPLTTVGQLITDRRVRKVKGHRIHPKHIHRDGHHTVLGPDEITGATPVGSRRVDRMLFAAAYENAALTKPGDIIYTTTPRFAVLIDHDGYNVAAFPARVLRVIREAEPSLTPRVLAALLGAARNTGRSPSAVRGTRIEALTIPDLERVDLEGLEEFFTEIEERLNLLRAQQDELAEIHRLTTTGFADGSLTINQR